MAKKAMAGLPDGVYRGNLIPELGAPVQTDLFWEPGFGGRQNRALFRADLFRDGAWMATVWGWMAAEASHRCNVPRFMPTERSAP